MQLNYTKTLGASGVPDNRPLTLVVLLPSASGEEAPSAEGHRAPTLAPAKPKWLLQRLAPSAGCLPVLAPSS